MLTTFTNFFKTSASFSTDIFILVGLFFLFFFFGMYFGKSRLISMILSFYPARFLFEHFPFMAKLTILQGPHLSVLNKAVIFLIFFLLIDILIGKYIFSETAGGSSQMLKIGGLSLACVALVLIFTYSVISLDVFYNFSPAIDALFNPSTYLFYWNAGVLGLLLLF